MTPEAAERYRAAVEDRLALHLEVAQWVYLEEISKLALAARLPSGLDPARWNSGTTESAWGTLVDGMIGGVLADSALNLSARRIAAEELTAAMLTDETPGEVYSTVLAIVSALLDETGTLPLGAYADALADALRPDATALVLTAAGGRRRHRLRGKTPPKPLPGTQSSFAAREAYARTRARTVATATAAREAIEELERTGWAIKIWRTEQDSKVRPEHAAAEGQAVPLSMPFRIGGVPMMYPGDPTAPASLRANCRCVLLVPGDAPEQWTIYDDDPMLDLETLDDDLDDYWDEYGDLL